jgi:hypothetical protein
MRGKGGIGEVEWDGRVGKVIPIWIDGRKRETRSRRDVLRSRRRV